MSVMGGGSEADGSRSGRDRVLARVSGVATSIVTPLLPVFVLFGLATLLVPETVTRVMGLIPNLVTFVVVGVFLASFAVMLIAGQLGREGGPGEPIALLPAIRGRCRVLNSPTSRTPSHGTHAYGQTYAIDLLHDPEDASRPGFGQGSGFLSPTSFPSWGAAVHAPCGGKVVTITDGARDHRSRTSWLAYGYLLVESVVRDAIGARHLLGNHVIIARDGGGYVLVAHLRRGSALVRTGDRVAPGQPIAQVGNSGNSSEPHVHMQLMDQPSPRLAAGLRFGFPDPEQTTRGDGEPEPESPTLPANGAVVVLR